MARNILKISTLALLAAASAIGAAHAGGFARGDADTDIIFEEGNFNLRAGATIVNPTRKYKTNSVAGLVGTDYADTYIIPSAAIKLNVNDDLRCAGTFSQPYGGSATWAVPTSSGKKSEQFVINEFGLNCGYKVGLAKGQAWVLGGLFQNSFDYSRTNKTPFGDANLTLAGTDYGFRVGAAYEIPEIALRAQLMYRSSTEYGAVGNLGLPTAAVVGGQAQALGAQALALQAQALQAAGAGNLVLAGQLGAQAASAGAQALALQAQIPALVAANAQSSLGALGTGNLPQSVEMKLQSGIAPGWLAFGSLKWTDWSVTKQLIVVNPTGTSTNDYFWRDGLTVTAGIGHQFTDSFSGAASITWDRGVSRGYDLSSDTWTIGAGGSLKDKMGGELKFGGGITYIAGATEFATAAKDSVGAGIAYALGASYKTKW